LVSGRGRERTFLSLPPRPDWLWGPSNLLSNQYWDHSSGIEQSWHEPDHSPLFGAEIKNV